MSEKPAIFKVQSKFWEEFGIFPTALEKRADSPRVQLDTNKYLLKLGLGNLAMLTESFGLPRGEELEKGELAAELQSAFNNNLLTHAIEFTKKRTREIEDVFENEAKVKVRAGAAERVRAYGGFREQVHPLSKTLLLLNQSEALLREVFYLASWQSKDTRYRFSQETHTKDRFAHLIQEQASELTELLQKTTNQGGELLGIHKIKDKLLVIVYLREYRPKVSRDYKSKLNLHHSCGTLVMGLNIEDGYFHLKSPSKDIAAAVEAFFRTKLKIEVTRQEDLVESAFDPNPLADLIKGNPPPSTISLSAIAFKRAAIGGVPLSIPLSPFYEHIHKTLQSLCQASIITFATPVNIVSFSVVFKGMPINIEAEMTSGGAMRFLYQNHGIKDSDQKEFESEFRSTWGFPLNKLLDPTRWKLGTAGIIACILKAKHSEDIEEYQRPIYKRLRELGVVDQTEETIWRCSNYGCEAPILREHDDHPCRACGAPVREIKVQEIATNDSVLRGWVGEFLGEQIAWTLNKKSASIEKKEYWPLLGPNPESERLACFFQHTLSAEVLQTFDRSVMPIVKYTNQIIDPPVRTERDLSVSVSVPFLLAASIEAGELPQLVSCLKTRLEDTASSYDSRISNAAQLSASRLETVPLEQNGDLYETDIYNVLHWIFWFTTRLGRLGVREPDGLISFQAYSEVAGEAGAPSWNVAYDAKFSRAAGGYDFAPEEQRQAREYIGRYFRSVSNSKHSRHRISGHAIISNNIKSEKIGAFVELLNNEGVIVPDRPSPAIALIRDGFITTLYRALSRNQEMYRRKRLHLHGYLIKLLRQTSKNGFNEFDSEGAKWILASLEKQEPIEDGVTQKQFDDSVFIDFPTALFEPKFASKDDTAISKY